MSDQTRRDFLGKALLAGAGAALVRPEYVLATDDVSAVVLADAPDPGFTAGQVVGVGKTSADFIVLDADKELRTLHTGPLSSLWKQGRWNSSGLEIGDCVYARGDALENGGLAIDRLWVDIKSSQVKSRRRATLPFQHCCLPATPLMPESRMLLKSRLSRAPLCREALIIWSLATWFR